MGRKSEVVAVPPGYGRDSEAKKHFLITEWPSRRADRWANAMLLAYTRGGIAVPESVLGRGMEAIFFLGVQCFLRGQIQSEEIQPLLDQLIDECVKIVRDPGATDKVTGGPVATAIVSEDDIEEIKTRWWLRGEVLRISTGFSVQEIVQRWLSAIMTPPTTSESIPQA